MIHRSLSLGVRGNTDAGFMNHEKPEYRNDTMFVDRPLTEKPPENPPEEVGGWRVVKQSGGVWYKHKAVTGGESWRAVMERRVKVEKEVAA